MRWPRSEGHCAHRIPRLSGSKANRPRRHSRSTSPAGADAFSLRKQLGAAGSVHEDKVEKGIPDEGILLGVPFRVSAGGPLRGVEPDWLRVCAVGLRVAFGRRRMEAKSPDELTTDLMELATWCEVAWLRMGEADLAAGAHRLQLRLPKTRDDQGKWRRVLYASDAICLHQGPFQPNSKWRPDEVGRDARGRGSVGGGLSTSGDKGAGACPCAIERRVGDYATTSNCPAKSPSRSGTAKEPDLAGHCGPKRQEPGARGSSVCASGVVSDARPG